MLPQKPQQSSSDGGAENISMLGRAAEKTYLRGGC
jgi:hypothetical protein